MSRNALLTPGSARLLVAYSGPVEPPAALPSESERVVVFIGGLDDGNFTQPEPLLKDAILPAVRSAEPQPQSGQNVVPR